MRLTRVGVNPTIAKLSETQLAAIAVAVGHPLRAIYVRMRRPSAAPAA